MVSCSVSEKFSFSFSPKEPLMLIRDLSVNSFVTLASRWETNSSNQSLIIRHVEFKILAVFGYLTLISKKMFTILFLRFLFLVLVSIEKLYQTLENVFHHYFKSPLFDVIPVEFR